MDWGQHRVDIYYQGLPGENNETVLDALAEGHGGQRLGSGFGCGQRDIEYRFHEGTSAQEFREAVMSQLPQFSLEAFVT